MYGADQVQKVLASAGVSIWSRSHSELIVFCPFHNNTRTPAGEINCESGLFYCFSCKHVATLEDFICKASGLEFFQSQRLIYLHKNQGSIVDLVSSILDKEKELPEFPLSTVEEMHELALTTPRALDYYDSRGITIESIKQFKLGYSKNIDTIVFPFMSPDGSKYIGVEARSIEGKRFFTDGPKSETLFNLNKRIWSPYVFLTESVLDCLRLEQLGIPDISSMGSNRGKTQVSLLIRYFNKIYIVQDNDTEANGFAGQASALKLLEKIGDRGIIVKPPQRYKDIGEMPDDEIKLMVDKTHNILEWI